MDFSSPRINVAISAHGYGHLTQTVAVLQALAHHHENMVLRIQSDLDRAIIADRLGNLDFDHEKIQMDVGLVQPDPLHVDLMSSLEAYAVFHDRFEEKVKEEALKLRDWGADIVLSDISYLALAAAAHADIPGIALASLSWDHIVKAYFDMESTQVLVWYQHIKEAYEQSTLALLPEPALTGDNFKRVQPIAPVYIPGQKNSSIRKELDIDHDDTRPLVLCSLGGIGSEQIPVEAMQKQSDFHWLIHVDRVLPTMDHLHTIERLSHWPYRHIIASVDGVIGKPGYGMAIEVAAHDLPFVYTRRGHFPDEPVISQWLDQHARALEISKGEWLTGNFTKPLASLWAQPKKPKQPLNGAEQAASALCEFL